MWRLVSTGRCQGFPPCSKFDLYWNDWRQSVNPVSEAIVTSERVRWIERSVEVRSAMYCPRCGQQKVSESVRFCSRCGFKLDVVKACLTTGGASDSPPLPKRSINLGVVLMLLGTVLTAGVVAVIDAGFAGAFLLLAISLASILLFHRPLLQAIYKLLPLEDSPTGQISPRLREVGFGATLMFMGTILSACAATLVPGRMGNVIFFSLVLTCFALLLLSSNNVMRRVQEHFTEGDAGRKPGERSLASPGQGIDQGAACQSPVLPLAAGISVSASDARRYTTGEVVAPPSVTETTTNLLESK